MAIDTVVVVTRLGLATVFLLAAATKLADMSGSRHALEDFRVPPSLISLASFALPAAEIAAGLLMIIAPTAQAGAALGVGLLLTFIVGIVAALRRGSAPDCHCFGQLHSRPAGRETIVRNSVLIGVGLFVVVAGPGPGLDSWLSNSSGDLVALAGTSLLATVLAYACLALWRDNRRLRGLGRRPDQRAPIEIGQLIPEFRLAAEGGAEVRSGQLLNDSQRTIVVFTSATCGPCVGLLPELARWRDMLIGRLAIYVLASGDPEENRRLATEHGMPLLLDRNGETANAFGILATPSAVEIDVEGRVAAPPAVGAPAIEGLIRAALKRPANGSGLEVHHANRMRLAPTASSAP